MRRFFHIALFVIAGLILPAGLCAQDPFFTQAFNAPLALNPATEASTSSNGFTVTALQAPWASI